MARRIVYVTSQFPFGAREAFLAPEVRALTRVVEAVIVVATHPKARSSVLADIDAQGLSTWNWATWAAAFRTVRRRPRTAGMLFLEMCTARYRPVAKLKNIAIFVKGLALAEICLLRRADAIHAHWLTTPSTAAAVAARLTDIALSISAHRFDVFADNWVTGKLSAARFVRVISERCADDLRVRTPVALRDRIRVVHLGVDLPPDAQPAFRADGWLRVLAIGFLTPVKGHDDLITAMALLRDSGVRARCEIAGDGPLRGALQARIEQLNLTNIVTLRGFVPHEQLLSELRTGAFAVLAHPSTEDGTTHEGIPVSLMEAMSCGAPCVATRTGSIGELIDTTCGMLVEQHNPAALAKALRTLAEDEPLRRRLGRAGRERVMKRFEASQTASALLALMFAT